MLQYYLEALTAQPEHKMELMKMGFAADRGFPYNHPIGDQMSFTYPMSHTVEFVKSILKKMNLEILQKDSHTLTVKMAKPQAIEFLKELANDESKNKYMEQRYNWNQCGKHELFLIKNYYSEKMVCYMYYDTTKEQWITKEVAK